MVERLIEETGPAVQLELGSADQGRANARAVLDLA